MFLESRAFSVLRMHPRETGNFSPFSEAALGLPTQPTDLLSDSEMFGQRFNANPALTSPNTT
jgi:hypothetical protein